MIAAAQTGEHQTSQGRPRKTYGHSMIVSPWGEIMADAGEDHGHNLQIWIYRLLKARVPVYHQSCQINHLASHDMVDSESALAIALFGEILTVHQLIRNQLDRVLPKGMELSHFSVLNHLANTKSEKHQRNWPKVSMSRVGL